MLEVGSLLDGKYKILNEIGHGGMSVVYLALNERANKTWAVKEVRKDAQKRGITPICTSEGMVRLRTDGHIWVVDQIKLDVE